MAITIDTSTEFGAKVQRRVESETLIWLTTVDSNGTPQPNPVWFLWQTGTFLLVSKPGQAKLKNIARHGRVSLNFEATPDEEQITIFTGSAELIDRGSLGQDFLDRYHVKYAQGMTNIGMTREQYESQYTEAIRVIPEKVRGW